MFINKRSVPAIIVVLMLLWAFYPHNPYGYYTCLRLACCGFFGYLLFVAIGEKMYVWAWIFGITALVYNPLVAVHLTRHIWSVINLITVGLAISSIWFLFSQEKKSREHMRPAETAPPKANPQRSVLKKR